MAHTAATTLVEGKPIVFRIGSIEISLHLTATRLFAVLVTRGGFPIEEHCGSYATETEARAIARLYAQLYRAETKGN